MCRQFNTIDIDITATGSHNGTMENRNPANVRQAERNFDAARQKARRERFWAWLIGAPHDEQALIPFEAIEAEVEGLVSAETHIDQIRLDQIIGSIGRYDEFTRHFLPLTDSLRDRWISVETYALEHGWPPIQVYQVGDGYFVVDGNHRVAVARQMGNDTIEARIQVVPNSGDIDMSQPLDQTLIELGRRSFLAQTELAQRVPDCDIRFTSPARFQVLREQIGRFQRLLAEIDGEDLSYQDATVSWYEMVYMPTAMLIEESGLLDHFPERTVSDLFVWLFQNRHMLRERHGDYENLAELLERITSEHDTHDKTHQHSGVITRTLNALGLQRPEPDQTMDL